MDDLISRQAAIDDVTEYEKLLRKILGDKNELAETVKIVKHRIIALPSAQPEIIRCKDCKWKQGAWCVRFAEVIPFPDDFCSRAERRTNEQTD